MPVVRRSQKRIRAALSLAVIPLSVFLLVCAGALNVAGQNQQTISRTVTITSDPPGATIWTKEGRNYACTNQLTPASIELKFHDENDVKQILLRKFGYSSRQFFADTAHDTRGAKLPPWEAPFFTAPDDASAQVRNLDAKIKKEFEATLIAGKDPFPCTPYEFVSIAVVDSGERHQLELGVLVDLHPSAAAKSLSVADKSHGTSEERLSKMGRAVLEGGMADIVARFRTIAAKFPEIKGIFLACSYSASEAYLDTVETPFTATTLRPGANGRQVVETTSGVAVDTVVKDQAAVKTLTIAVPLTAIPAAGETKAVTEAVLSHSSIRLYGAEE